MCSVRSVELCACEHASKGIHDKTRKAMGSTKKKAHRARRNDAVGRPLRKNGNRSARSRASPRAAILLSRTPFNHKDACAKQPRLEVLLDISKHNLVVLSIAPHSLATCSSNSDKKLRPPLDQALILWMQVRQKFHMDTITVNFRN